MGKDDKEDSGFGFKDKAKAVETLRLLEQHEPNYRRLTVRGLLGRAKRTLSMTKAEEKKKNIKEAMEVFENWLAELDKDKTEKKGTKKETKHVKPQDNDEDDKQSSDVEMKEAKPSSEKVPNLGFKDAAAAHATIQELEGRDPEYQRLAVKGLIGSANRVLTNTRDETKLENIKEAISILEKFLDSYDSNHMAKQNNGYLSLGIVNAALDLAGDDVSSQQRAFIAAYSSVNGEYKRLRTVAEKEDGKTWDIVRNLALKELKDKHANAKLFDDEKKPTKEHIQMLLWAYSPEPAQVKKSLPEKQTEETSQRSTRKRKSSAKDDESPIKKQKE